MGRPPRSWLAPVVVLGAVVALVAGLLAVRLVRVRLAVYLLKSPSLHARAKATLLRDGRPSDAPFIIGTLGPGAYSAVDLVEIAGTIVRRMPLGEFLDRAERDPDGYWVHYRRSPLAWGTLPECEEFQGPVSDTDLARMARVACERELREPSDVTPRAGWFTTWAANVGPERTRAALAEVERAGGGDLVRAAAALRSRLPR